MIYSIVKKIYIYFLILVKSPSQHNIYQAILSFMSYIVNYKQQFYFCQS